MTTFKDIILVIRHGAFGDIILSMGPLAAIRHHHPDAHIVMLTTQPFEDLYIACPYVDEVWVDPKPKFWQWSKIAQLYHMLKRHQFSWIYDLQTSGRTDLYHHIMRYLLPYPLRWSGSASGASHQDLNPDRCFIHTIEREQIQLEQAGITFFPSFDLDWMCRGEVMLEPNKKYVLLVPGGSAHRLEKRWPRLSYEKLVYSLNAMGYTPILIGSKAERDISLAFEHLKVEYVDYIGRTDLFKLATLARRAQFAVGNDTGPMHLFAALGVPSLVLFSGASAPERCAPRGKKVAVLRKNELQDVTLSEVIREIKNELISDQL